MASLRLSATRAGLLTAVAALAGSALVLTAPAASATTLHHKDQAHDVVRFDDDSDVSTPDPGRVNGDIVHVKMWHSANRVGIKASFADLKRSGAFRMDILQIVTNEGLTRDATVFSGTDFTNHEWRGDVDLEKPNGESVKCHVSHSVDYEADVLTIGVPRSCLSSPKWVRLGFGVATIGDDESTEWADDALIDGSVAQDLAMTDKIYR